jgi:ABC-type uncharacterized transport system ATPase subunit
MDIKWTQLADYCVIEIAQNCLGRTFKIHSIFCLMFVLTFLKRKSNNKKTYYSRLFTDNKMLIVLVIYGIFCSCAAVDKNKSCNKTMDILSLCRSQLSRV